MAKYMSDKDIQEYLQEGLEEYGTVQDAFDYLLENEVRDVFEMDQWDDPEFDELIIPFNGINYKIKIQSDGCIEVTNEHRIMDWSWTVTPVE